MRERMRCVAVAVVLAVVFLGAEAKAAPVVWQLEGHVEGVYSLGGVLVDDPQLSALGVVPGASFTATIVVEAATPDADSSTNFASFADGVLAMSFSAGSYSVSVGAGAAYSQLSVNVAEQAMIANMYAPGTPSMFNPILGLEVVADVPGTFTDAMPVDPPPLANLHPFDLNDPFFGFGTSFAVLAEEQIRGSLTRWARVPEPEVAWLALAALAGLGLRLRPGR